jgi:ribonuclease P protein component
MRESFRKHQHDLIRPVDLVLVARGSIARMKLRDVEKDLLLALKKGRMLKGPE